MFDGHPLPNNMICPCFAVVTAHGTSALFFRVPRVGVVPESGSRDQRDEMKADPKRPWTGS